MQLTPKDPLSPGSFPGSKPTLELKVGRGCWQGGSWRTRWGPWWPLRTVLNLTSSHSIAPLLHRPRMVSPSHLLLGSTLPLTWAESLNKSPSSQGGTAVTEPGIWSPDRAFCPVRGRFCGGLGGYSLAEGSRVLVTARPLSLFGPQGFSPVES